jgi:hypothetical protein
VKITILIFGLALTASAQGTFQNLDFEEANPVVDPGGQFYPYDVTATSAFPGWTVYLGNIQQTDVLQDLYTSGQASVDVFGPDYPAAGANGNLNPGTIDGHYSTLLQAGNLPGSQALVGASIVQTGTLPSDTQSIEFKAWQPFLTPFTVSFNGIPMAPVILGSGPNYTLYGANIPLSYGTTGPLEFTSDYSDTGESWLGLDDISFSDMAVTPEPNPLILTGIGGLIFAMRQMIRHR